MCCVAYVSLDVTMLPILREHIFVMYNSLSTTNACVSSVCVYVYIGMHMCMCKAHVCACLHKHMCNACDTCYTMYIVGIVVTCVELTSVCGLCSTSVLRHTRGGEVTMCFVRKLSVWMRQSVACSCVFGNTYHST